MAIHGCIDASSQSIVWLKVTDTNNNPSIIAQYYVSCAESLHTAPRIVRAERGSENTIIEGLQSFLRASDLSSRFQNGSSTRNQRIESWWNQLRRLRLNWWINYLKDMRDISIFDNSLKYHNV